MSRTQLTNDNISAGGAAYTSTSNPSATTNTVNGLTLAVGQVWLNTATGQMYSCTDATTDANVWTNVGLGYGQVPSPVFMTATGGTITTDGNFKVHTFNGSGVFTPTIGTNASVGNKVEYLVIAGGGGGSGNHAGGGGAGGYRTATGLSIAEQRYTITVGAGGIGGDPSTNGSDSVFSSITADGGGEGGYEFQDPGSAGGSGGGGANASAAGGAATAGQGNAGGTGGTSGGGGGGGGAGAVGANGGSAVGGVGGNGLSSDIVVSGTNVIRAGGGGGGGVNLDASGGTGGGGVAYTDGGVNKGGGGGGGWTGGASDGGSGVVIIRYQFQ